MIKFGLLFGLFLLFVPLSFSHAHAADKVELQADGQKFNVIAKKAIDKETGQQMFKIEVYSGGKKIETLEMEGSSIDLKVAKNFLGNANDAFVEIVNNGHGFISYGVFMCRRDGIRYIYGKSNLRNGQVYIKNQTVEDMDGGRKSAWRLENGKVVQIVPANGLTVTQQKVVKYFVKAGRTQVSTILINLKLGETLLFEGTGIVRFMLNTPNICEWVGGDTKLKAKALGQADVDIVPNGYDWEGVANIKIHVVK